MDEAQAGGATFQMSSLVLHDLAYAAMTSDQAARRLAQLDAFLARVEVVAWASCQPYLPCAGFALLSVLAYVRGCAGRPSCSANFSTIMLRGISPRSLPNVCSSMDTAITKPS